MSNRTHHTYWFKCETKYVQSSESQILIFDRACYQRLPSRQVFCVGFFFGIFFVFCISLLQKPSASFNRLQRLSIGHDNWSICLFPIMKQNINTPLDKWLRVVIHPRGQANISTAEARQLDQQNLQLHKLELTGKCAFLPSKTRVSIGAC